MSVFSILRVFWCWYFYILNVWQLAFVILSRWQPDIKYLSTSSTIWVIGAICHLEAAVAPLSGRSSPPTSLLMRPPSGRCEVCSLRPVSCWSPDWRHVVGRFLSTLKSTPGVTVPVRKRRCVHTHAGLFVFVVWEQDPMKMPRTNWEAARSPGIFKGVQLRIPGTWRVSAWITLRDHLHTLF